MEYLMTYGWSILIIAVVLGALFGLGIFNGTALLSSGCIAQPGFLCQMPVLSTNGTLSVSFGQVAQQQIDVAEVGCSNTTAMPSSFYTLNLILQSGQVEPGTTFTCPLPSNAIGASFTGTLWIKYTTQQYPGLTVPEEIGTVALKVARVGASSGPSRRSAALHLTSFGASSPVVVGSATSLVAVVSGGVPPYTVEQWYKASSDSNESLSARVSGGAGATSSDTESTPGTYYYYFTVTDNAMNTAISPIIPVNFISSNALAIEISLAANAVDYGSDVNMTVDLSGGAPDYTFTSFSDADTGASGWPCMNIPLASFFLPGSFQCVIQAYNGLRVYSTDDYTWEFTDSNSVTATNSITENLDQLPQAALGTSAPTIESGGGEVLTSYVEEGTGPFTLTWQGSIEGNVVSNNRDCLTPEASDGSYYCTFIVPTVNSPTQDTYTFNIIDADGNTASANAVVTITPTYIPPSVTLSSSAAEVDQYNTLVLTAVISDGIGPYTISWQGSIEGTLTSSDSDCPTSASNSGMYTCTITAPPVSNSMPDTYTVNVIDGNSNTATASNTVTINPALLAMMYASSSATDSGDTLVLTGNIVGGTGPYTLDWYGNVEGTLHSSDSDCPTTVSSDGTYTCTILAPAVNSPVSDQYFFGVFDADVHTSSEYAYVTINPDPEVTSMSASESTAYPGDELHVSGTISGGTAPYTLSWTGSYEGTLTSADSDCITSEPSGGGYSCSFYAPDVPSTRVDTYTLGVTDALSNMASNSVGVNVVGTPVVLATGSGGPWGVATDGSYVYFGNQDNGTIDKVPIGGGAVTQLASGLNGPTDVATDGADVYWTDYGDDYVDEVSVNGGGVTQLTSGNRPWTIASTVADGYIFWADNDNVYQTSISTGNTIVLASGQSDTWDIASDGTNVYWVTYYGYVGQVPIGGGTITTLSSGGADGDGLAIATDGTNVYWGGGNGNYQEPVGGGAVTQLNPAGSGAASMAVSGGYVYTEQGPYIVREPVGVSEPSGETGGSMTVLATFSGSTRPGGLAVGDGNVYWTIFGTGEVDQVGIPS